MLKKQFFVYGRVQGVAFRFFTWKQAKKLGVCGTVRNCADGSVEVTACADESVMNEFAAWLEKGSPSANVTRVITLDYQMEKNFDDFQIIR